MDVATIFGQFILGWLLADLLSGIFHWWEDRIPSEKMPVMGQWLIAPNRLHHREPLAFTKGTFRDRNQATIVGAAVVSVIWLLIAGPSVFWFATTLGGMVTTEVHRYAHQPKKANLVLHIMQETGFIQSPKHHAKHHRPPSNVAYCILTDWMNPVLDALKVWDRIERLLVRLGCKPSLGQY